MMHRGLHPAGVDCMGIYFERVLVDVGADLLKRLANIAVGDYTWVSLLKRADYLLINRDFNRFSTVANEKRLLNDCSN